MHPKLISYEELREENRMTFFLKHSHPTIECYFCRPIIEIDCLFFYLTPNISAQLCAAAQWLRNASRVKICSSYYFGMYVA